LFWEVRQIRTIAREYLVQVSELAHTCLGEKQAGLTMMGSVRVSRAWLYPIGVWLLLLAVVFVTEYAVMLVLPWVLHENYSRALEAIVDAIVLTLIVAPAMWWTIVRPLVEVIRLRTQFLTDLFEQIERDRRQTAHELHDGVGQSLTLLISGLRSAKSCRANAECSGRVNDFQRLAEDALKEVRRLSLSLRPSLLDDLGLAPALERLIEDIRAHYAAEIALDIKDVVDVKLADGVATAVFRIVQEALSNVMKHSQAEHVTVALRRANGNVLVEVADDGCGIDPARLDAIAPGHLGLKGMRERATLLGGRFDLQSAPEKGTRISASLPARGIEHG
jgi:signal transduction histidine kinase